jgi:hypothetical protein
MKEVFPSNVKGENCGAYWKLPRNVYVTADEGAACAIIDSATEDVLVVYWSQCDQTYFHYTNGLGAGEGGVASTRAQIAEWIDANSDDFEEPAV